MNTSTRREGFPGPSRSLSKRVCFLSLALLALAILSVFVLPPDATKVLGYSSNAPSLTSPDNCTHQVRRGENLFRIGLRYGVPYQYLAMVNGISSPQSIISGSVLSVPCGPNAQPNMPPDACGPAQTHIVKPGDNLFRIALNHGSTVDLLRSANNLYGRVLHPGMKLSVPCAGSVGNAPVPLTGAQPAPGAPASPTKTVAAPAPAITPQVTVVSPGARVTPAVTLVPSPPAIPPVSTPVTHSPAPLVVTTPVPLTLDAVIHMRGNQFDKNVVQIGVGGRVTWVNDETDGTVHSVSCAECPPSFSFDSGSNPIGPGQSYSVLFTTAGVYFYYSRLQPNMIGMIIVNP